MIFKNKIYVFLYIDCCKILNIRACSMSKQLLTRELLCRNKSRIVYLNNFTNKDILNKFQKMENNFQLNV